ncbi:MAG: helix-turn-helix domain-containing protein [Elusimicrobia bacterium]|nr:helix-turn-helix domain-containing protein [Elusimicrobiota bacterium]
MKTTEKLTLIQKITGLPQEKLADKLGVSFATLNSWINGRSLPRKKTSERIDLLYKECTGQKIIPTEILEAKKALIINKSKSIKNAIKIIHKNPDIRDEFMLSLTYNTNRIEGSTLTEPETAAILFNNTALPNKSLIEQMEVKNHQAALNFLLNNITELGMIDEVFILKLHGMLMNGIRDDAGFYRRHQVRIAGANVPTANYIKVPVLMHDLIKNIHIRPKDLISHISAIHSNFEKIHPFSDGNGRIGRLLIHAMAFKHNIPPAIIKQEKRHLYYTYLNKAQLQDDITLLEDFLCDAFLDGFNIIERK